MGTMRHQRLARNASKYLFGAVACYLLFFVLLLVGRAGPIVFLEAFAAMLGSVLLLAAILYRVLSDYTADDGAQEPAPGQGGPRERQEPDDGPRGGQFDQVVAGIRVVGMMHEGVMYLLREDVALVLGTSPETITSSIDPAVLQRFNYSPRATDRRHARASFIRASAIAALAERFPGPAAAELAALAASAGEAPAAN